MTFIIWRSHIVSRSVVGQSSVQNILYKTKF